MDNLRDKLWTQRYRPKSIDEYVFVDERQRTQVETWIKEGSFPHLLLSGEPGCGKGSLYNVLIHELDVNPYDILEINASRENGIDMIRERINGFVQTIPFGKFKVVFLDEVDHLSIQGQAALRNDMEAYADTVRYVLRVDVINFTLLNQI